MQERPVQHIAGDSSQADSEEGPLLFSGVPHLQIHAGRVYENIGEEFDKVINNCECVQLYGLSKCVECRASWRAFDPQTEIKPWDGLGKMIFFLDFFAFCPCFVQPFGRLSS